MTTIIKALDGVTATTTSNAINIEGAKKVTFLFKRADHVSGKTVFTVTGQVVPTETFIALPLLIANAAIANSETVARVANYDTGTANASALYALDLTYFALKEIKVVATETTDGTHSAWVFIEY